MTTGLPIEPYPIPGTFREEASAVMTRLRNALRGLLAAVPGSIQSPKELQDALGINYKLAWQVHRIASASNPLEEAGSAPGAAAFEKFLRHVEKRAGTPAGRVAAARDAVDEFGAMIRRHAGDRATLDTMLSGLSGEAPERIELNQRKAAYRANSHIWGIQIRARIACIIIQPSKDDPRRIDLVMVRGVIGLKQLRRGRPFVISSVVHLDSENVVDSRPEIEQLGLAQPSHGINLLREYCSDPLPDIRNRMTDQGRLVTELMNRDVGASTAFTGFLCDIFRKNDARYREESNFELVLGSNIQYPTEVNVIDVFVRRGTYGADPLPFRSECRSLTGGAEPYAADHDVLFRETSIEHLGRGAESLHSPDYPRYTEMVSHVMGRLGWATEEFEAYRHRQMYPIMPSAVVTVMDLPNDPGA